MESLAMSNMMEEREELMVSPTGGETTLRTAHFLKPSVSDLSSASLPSNLIIWGNKKIPFKVQFVGRKYPQEGWKEWVDRLKPSYQHIWKKAGIFEAILSSTYQILRDNELVLTLAERWCFETNTFIFPWGEATITLEDTMVLGGYSVSGDSVLSPLRDENLIEIENKLGKAHGVISQRRSQGARHCAWMNHFMGSGRDLEHEAFLALWLSRYVLPTSYDSARKTLLPIAIKLSRGISIALAPAVLGSIYRDLRLLKQTLVALAKLDAYRCNGAKLVLTAPFQLVQLWAWERFLTLRPEPRPIKFGEPRVARWHELSKLKVEDVGEAIDAAGESFFQWRPYVIKLINWDFGYFYRDISGYVLVDSDMGTEVESMVRFLRVSELVGLDCIEQYLPHRVALQFGCDQDLPGCVRRSNETPEIAWSNYNRPVNDAVLYRPARLFEGDVTTRYLEWRDQLKSEKESAANVMLSGIPSHCHTVNEGAIAHDDELTIAETFSLHKDNLANSEASAIDEDNLTIAELLNLKRASTTQDTPRAMDEANAVEARGIVSVDKNENNIHKCRDGVNCSEFCAMNVQNGAFQRPDEARNIMMKLEHRIRNLEKTIAEIEVAKITPGSKKPM